MIYSSDIRYNARPNESETNKGFDAERLLVLSQSVQKSYCRGFIFISNYGDEKN